MLLMYNVANYFWRSFLGRNFTGLGWFFLFFFPQHLSSVGYNDHFVLLLDTGLLLSF